MKTPAIILSLCLLMVSVSAQTIPPQIRLSGNVGPKGVFTLFNSGKIVMASDSDYTMQYPDMSAHVLIITSSVPLTATRNVFAPQPAGFEFIVENVTTGGQSIVLVGSSGTGVSIPNGQAALVISDGTNYVLVGSVSGVGGPLTPPVIIRSLNGLNTLTINVPNTGDPNFVSSTGIVDLSNLFVSGLAGTGTVCLQVDALGNVSRTTAPCGTGGTAISPFVISSPAAQQTVTVTVPDTGKGNPSLSASAGVINMGSLFAQNLVGPGVNCLQVDPSGTITRSGLPCGGLKAYTDASVGGVKADANVAYCNVQGGNSTINCFNGAHFSAATDIGKTFICYGCGAVDTNLASPPAYVSGGVAPAGFPLGSYNQRVDFIDGGVSAGESCATPPAGYIVVNNGVPQNPVYLLWSGDGCAKVPTTMQIAGFTGTSTVSGGALGHAVQILTITAVTNASTITVSPVPISNAGQTFVYGTDDTNSWQSLINSMTLGPPGSNQAGAGRISFAGASIISKTLAFFNWSGELTGNGNMPLVGFNTGNPTQPTGSAFVWAGTTPGIPMIDNQGGSNMSYHGFGMVGNASAPPVAISMSGFVNGSQLGAQNMADDLVIGQYSSEDPNNTNGVGTWSFNTGIMANTVPGNADFMRICLGVGCTFNGVKYPADGNNDQAVNWQWGTLRIFNAWDAFCSVGSPHVEVLESAFTGDSVLYQGSCQFYSGTSAGSSYASFDNVSSDGDSRIYDGHTGEGVTVVAGGGFGISWLHNDGYIVLGNNPGGNVRLDIEANVGASAAFGYSGFPVIQITAPTFGAAFPQRFNMLSPSWEDTSAKSQFNTVASGYRWKDNAPTYFSADQGYFGYTGMTLIRKFNKGVGDGFSHHQEWETMGITETTGIAKSWALRSPDYGGPNQITGATPGTTLYSYAAQCVIDGKRAQITFDSSNAGEGGAGGALSNSITTGAATLTPVNANTFGWLLSLGCESYIAYRNTGSGWQCLAKNGACVETPWYAGNGFGASIIDDGSYTLGPVLTDNPNNTGTVEAQGGIYVGGASHKLGPSDLANNANLWPATAGIATASGKPGIDFAPHTMTSNDMTKPQPSTSLAGYTNVLSSYIATSSSYYAVAGWGYFAFEAFDGRNGLEHTWIGTGGGIDWLQIDLGSGNSEVLASYAVQSTDYTITNGQNGWPFPGSPAQAAPAAWQMQGSNDNATWTTLDTQTGQTYWRLGEHRTYRLSSTPAAYRYFRLNVTANNGDPTYTAVGELYLYRQGWGGTYNATSPVPPSYLGTGSTGTGSNCLTDAGTWVPCGAGGGGSSVNPLYTIKSFTNGYTILASDFTSCATLTYGGATAATINFPATAPPNGQCVRIFNYSTAAVTINTGSLTVNGIPAAASSVLPGYVAGAQFSNVTMYISDGTSLWKERYLNAVPWSEMQAGNLASKALTIGNGATFGPIGSGVVNANQVNSAAVPTSATSLGTNASGQLISVPGGNMVWPTGPAGSIPNYNGANGWGTSYNSTNTIPNNFIGTLNQSTTGNAATATNIATNGTASQVWGMNSAGTSQGWQTAGAASVALSSITPATTSNTINNANFAQTWKWALTAANSSGLLITENTFSNGTGSSLVNINTLGSSSANPLQVTARGTTNGVQIGAATGNLTALGTAKLVGPVQVPAVAGATVLSTDATGNVTALAGQNATYVLSGPPLSANPVPPTIVQSKICTAATGTSITCAFTVPTTVGNLIIVGPPYRATAVSDNLGQTYTNSPNYPYESVYYKENSAGGVTSTTTTVAGPGGAVIILEVSQIASSGSLDQDIYNVGNLTGPGTPITWGQISTSNPADFVLGYWVCPVNSSTTPTAVTGWTLGGYVPTTGNSWSGGFVWQNGTTIMSFRPAVATADCAQQQNSMALAFKASLVGSTGPATFRPLQAADLPNRPWSSITNPPNDYLLQLNMGTGGTIFNWNIAATNTIIDYGFGLQLTDVSTTNPNCINYPLPDFPDCRVTLDASSQQTGIWPMQANAYGAPTSSANYPAGFHVSGATGDIVMQGGSSIQLPNMVNAPALGTDANGRIIVTTGGTGTGINPLYTFKAVANNYNITSSDFSSCVTFTNTAGTNSTMFLPTTAPPSGQCIRVLNYGTGAVSLNPGSLTINGSTSVNAIPGYSTSVYYSNSALIISTGSAYLSERYMNSVPFGSVQGGTLLTQGLVLGNGASLNTSGSGVINANEVNGGGIAPSLTSLATNSLGQIVAGTAGGMVWPAGGAGIPNYNGTSAWGTSYSATNTIPANFISTLNQNTTGTAAGLSAAYIDWNAASGGASILNRPTIPTSANWPNGGSCTANQYMNAHTNGNTPVCSQVTYGQLGGVVPTWNQNTTGTAANITATTNSTLTTLSALALPYSQLSGTVPTWNQNTTGNAATSSNMSTNGTANQVWAMDPTGATQGWFTSTATTATNLAGGSLGTVPYQSAAGTTAMTGSNGSTAAAVLTETGTGTVAAAPVWNLSPAISAINMVNFPTLNQNTSGSAAKLAGGTTNSIVYQSAVGTTSFLAGNTATSDQVLISHGTGSAANAPTFGNAPALSAANMTAFPTLNQSTTGTAANITATSNSTLTTLSALSLPYSQLSGSVPTWNQSTTGNAATATNIATNGSGNQVWAMNAAGTLQTWSTPTASALPWSSLTAPTTNLSLNMGNNYTTLLSQFATSGAANTLQLGDTGTNNPSGGATILFINANSTHTTVNPFTVQTGSGALIVDSTGSLTASGTALFIGAHRLPGLTSTAVLATDSSGNIIAGTAGGMTWPTGSAGIPNYSGSNSWGTTYNAASPIPANFLSPSTSIAGGVLGSVPYQSGTGSTAMLAPNTTTSQMVFVQTGTGTVGAAPAWTASPTINANNMPPASFPTLNQSTTGSSAKLAGGQIGAIPYQSGASATSFLLGNNLATDTVLVSHGTGSAAQAPTLSNAPALNAANMTNAVTSFTGDGALITNSGNTGAVTTLIHSAGAHTYFGNNTGSTAQPAFLGIVSADLPTTIASNTTGTAAGITTNGGAFQVWGMNSAGTTQGWQSYAGPLYEQTFLNVSELGSVGGINLSGSASECSSTSPYVCTVPAAAADTSYRLGIQITQTGLGTACTGGGTLQFWLNYTDPDSGFVVSNIAIPATTIAGTSYAANMTTSTGALSGGTTYNINPITIRVNHNNAFSYNLRQTVATAGCTTTQPTVTMRVALWPGN